MKKSIFIAFSQPFPIHLTFLSIFLLSTTVAVLAQNGAIFIAPEIAICGNGAVQLSGGNYRNDSLFTDSIPYQQAGLPACLGGVNHNYCTLVISTDSLLWVWGYNIYGHLGLGDTINRPQPVIHPYLSKVKAVKSNDYCAYTLHGNGSVMAWGNNYLGDSTTGVSNMPKLITGLENVHALSTFYQHVLALKTDGTVWAWGSNIEYQLGNGSQASSYYPKQVMGLPGIRSIAAGDKHSMAVDSAGNVWAWGSNGYGQFGDTTLGYFQKAPTQLTSISNVSQVAAGHSFSLMLKIDDTVWACGQNTFGKLGIGTTNGYKQMPVQVVGLVDVKQISCAQDNAFALTNDGIVWSWGMNYGGNLGDGTRANRNAPVRFLSSCTGNEVDEVIEDKTLVVFPNPSTGIFQLPNTLYLSGDLELLNTVGQQVTFQLNGNQIDLSNQPKGIYYLKSSSENASSVYKLVLE